MFDYVPFQNGGAECVWYSKMAGRSIALVLLVIAGQTPATSNELIQWRSSESVVHIQIGVSGSGRPELELNVYMGVLATGLRLHN